MKKTIIGIMGPGDKAEKKDTRCAYALGKLIAEENWVLLTGGRNKGVMDAANKGAKEGGGITVGILPDKENIQTSEDVDIPIYTDMGSARNNINVLTSDVVVACGIGAGTASEIAMALKAKKPVIMLTEDQSAKTFFQNLSKEKIHFAITPEETIKVIKTLI